MLRESWLQFWWRREPVEAPRLDEAYRLARAITREASKSFFLSTRLLPTQQRRAVRALYAFCRATDNLVDSAGTKTTLATLEQWRLRSRRPAQLQDDLVLLAWADTRDQYGVPQQFAEELIDGVAMDLTIKRYQDFASLERYCYCVASTVGLMVMHIVGCADERPETMREAIPYATRLGVAMQLTNILRDIGEDARAGRIYLPLDEVQAAGYSEEELLAGAITPAFRRLLAAQIDRANALYDSSLPGIKLLHPNSRFAIAAAAAIYRGILPKIVANDYDVFTRRAHLTLREKLSLLPRARADC